eukprot:g7027.t2
MEAIVVRALTKIATDCPRRQSLLKKQCRETLAVINDQEQARQEGEPPDTEANKYMPCLLAACASGVPKVVTTALDAIVKLMDYGYIQDVEVESDDEDSDDEPEAEETQQKAEEAEAPWGRGEETPPQADPATTEPPPGQPPADGEEDSSPQSKDGASPEQESGGPAGALEEQVEPVSPSAGAPGLVQAAAEAGEGKGADGASQPQRFAPQRMFMDEVVERVCDCDLETEEVQLQVIKALVHACTATTLKVHQASLLTAVKTIYTVHLSTHDSINKNTAKASLQQMLSVVFSRMEAKDTELKQAAAAAAELESLRQSDPINYPRPPPPTPEEEPQPEPMPDAVFNIPDTMYPEVAETMEMTELYKTVPDLSPEEIKARRKRYRRALRGYQRRRWEATTVQPFPSVEHEDAFLLFRALCKLSLRPDHAGPGDGLAVAPTAEEARQMESKAVSLEMLLAIVDHSGPGFRGSEKFILAVRHYLCDALLLNSTSSNKAVMELSLKIFKPMCRDFKAHLKSQIEVFITTVFLRVLESENSTFDHKKQVLDVVTTFSDTPQALVEIFLTYDCDLHAIDLYNRIVNALSKISKGRGMSNADLNNNPSLLKEESYLRTKGLEGLVNILQNMLRCVASDVSADINEQGELLDGNRQISGDSTRGGADSTEPPANGSLGDTLGSTAGGIVAGGEQGEVGVEVDMKSPVSVVQEYDRKKKLAGDLGNGFVRFNLSPAKGVSYLVEKGMLVYEPRAVATFLLENCDKLDKTQIGEYLGKEIHYKDGFCVQVLHEYVDMMDFKGMRFDDAIRHYLSGFRLPGEAQKIDRMMEKFSERFCLQNPTVFPSADTAFILAFSIIMLNTDLHNPAIKEERRMTREGFAANNRGIAAGGNLEESFLNEIFDHIRANPISLKEDDKAREKGENQGASASAFPLYFTAGPSVRQKREAFNKEREGIIKDTEALFRLRKKQASAAKAQALARAAEEAAAAAAAAGEADGEPMGKVPEAVKAIEAKLAGAPPASVSVALRADSASEGRRDVVRAMFEVAWWPMLGAFSQVLEDVDHIERADNMTEEQDAIETEMVALCVKGCRFGIRLGSLCSRWAGGEGEGSIARETFVNSLAKFTLLDTVKEMRPKSIDCVRALVDIALEDGNYLAESWGSVLRYISQLARLQLFASGLHTDDHFFTSEDGSGGGGGGGGSLAGGSMHSVASRRDTAGGGRSTDGGGGSGGGGVGSFSSGGRKSSKSGGMFTRVNPTEQARDVERMNAEAVSLAVDPAMIDRVFSKSPNLSTDAVKHFVTQLCAVSSQEVNHSAATFRSRDILGDMSQPRIFCLQKLVEVADFNMDSRGRIVWAHVWGVLGEHFSKLGAHPNRYVSEYAVDSLKQLALKFVYKEELEGFNFQRLFLSPFESVFVATQHKDIKVLVLDCVQNLVQARSAHIRSGWKSIFSVLALAAKDGSDGPTFPRQAWEVVRRLVDEEMGSLVYDFLDVTKCLVAFLEGPDTDLALQSIERLKMCADHLAKGDLHILPPALHGHMSTGQGATADAIASAGESGNGGQELVYLQLWWPLLFGLSETMGDSRPDVRSGALSALSGILSEHGSIFSAQTWGLLFRGVVSPVFENAITDPSRPLSSAWPGQEEDPLEVAAAEADRLEAAAAARAEEERAAEEERKAKKAAAGSGWSLLSRPFSALSGGGSSGGGGANAARSTGSPRAGPPTTPRSPRAPAAFETGWTATMAEPLLDMCFEIFFKYEKITLPLLPEILALHQRCICQESEVLARIGLRSLGRFVTTMHKSFPGASDTISRPKATTPRGEDGGSAGSSPEDTDDKYTVWDTLTSSLCAIVHDNLPLELLSQPFHIVPEVSPLPEAGNGNGNPSSESPAWMDTAGPSSDEDSSGSSGSSDDDSEADGVEKGDEASESSWGELQDAGAEAAAEEGAATVAADGAEEGDVGRAEASAGVGVDAGGAAESTAAAEERGASREGGMEEEEQEGGLGSAQQQAGREEGATPGNDQEGGRELVADGSTSAPASPPADDSDVVMVSPGGGRAVSDSGSDYEAGSVAAAAGGGGGVARRPNLGALMTMLVVSLRMQRLVHWVVRKRCLDGLSAENLVDLLAALEAASVVALRFNRHHNLRRALGQVGFMTRGQPVALCPMLEQEVAGYNLLLQTLVVLSRGLDVDSGEPVEGGAGWPFAQERLVQACKCVVLAYADREEHAMGLEMSQPGLDHSALVEEVKETTALVILALGSMMHISEEQVRLNVAWMYGSMTRLVRCNSEEVRHHVQQILIFKMGPAMVPQPAGVGP